MGLIVMKFGGTSVGSIERIRRVAGRIMERKRSGDQVIAVVSAMGKTTDELVRLANEAVRRPNKRELDMLLSTGEQQTCALLTMILEDMGAAALSLTGWQAGITTESVFGNARIKEIQTERLQKALHQGKIVVVAGFQGITENDEITTLGRGGSDTTAVALAAAVQADLCEIYTDVDGVYTTDPRYVKAARKLDEISYDEMLEMAYLGAGVLHPRAVENAKKYKVPLVVRSSFNDTEGTVIKEEAQMENQMSVRGLAFERNVVKVTLHGLPNKMTTLSDVFKKLADARINIDIIIQNISENGLSLSFTIAVNDLDDTIDVLEKEKAAIGYQYLETEAGLAKVSIVGSGMASNPGVAATCFSALSDQGILIKMVSTSEIKVSTVIAGENLEKALQVLHETFQLDMTVRVG
ncbi:aspartate kinase [Tuberibacillus calidus]|jgi:aspartate kinase|uniref:aspartate kinase n=1 Tax=Tuberibacillus calidus TaxID=340097 RepID=UPI00041E8C2C|nr:aspartate kinase [Tuberibacillus calidus]